MADVDLRAAWACGIWCGIPQRMLRERATPLSEKGRRQIRAAVEGASAANPYLEERGAETLAILDTTP